MTENNTQESLFAEGDWVSYNGILHKVRAVSFNEAMGEIVYFLQAPNASFIDSVLQSEAVKCLKKA